MSYVRRSRKLTIIAQDPALRDHNGRVITTCVEVPSEELAPGPRGARVHVIDYDASTDTLYRPLFVEPGRDPYAEPEYEREPGPEDFAYYNQRLLQEPSFHAQNVYAIVMRTLARFEFALGRRVSWSFHGHQLIVAPHAFREANAFYAKDQRALFFGYFQGEKGPIFSCLAHDVIAHETTHALLDGLRQRYIDPSGPEQAAFHEGFADVVALLSVFSLEDVVKEVIDRGEAAVPQNPKLIAKDSLTPRALRDTVLFGLAEEMGREMSQVRGKALRRSAELEPSRKYIRSEDFLEPHRRGEIFVAAVMNAFLGVWVSRLEGLGEIQPGFLDRARVVEEGAAIADYLLTMCIRAIDYCPATDLEFCDFLSAVLTADRELRQDDSRYQFRKILRESFSSYGIDPTSRGDGTEPGVWEAPDCNPVYDRCHFESLQRDPDEVFRFIWENRGELKLCEDAYTRVLSVRPCLRVGPDGFAVSETVAQYMQILTLRARELPDVGVEAPANMPPHLEVTLYGGGILIFDEFGRLKLHVRNRVLNRERQSRRLNFLWEYGYLGDGAPESSRSFAAMHRTRVLQPSSSSPEVAE